ncbi:hypothetical protein D3C77_298320 [compost metagenome]
MAVPSIVGTHVSHPFVEKISEILMLPDATVYWPHTVSTESLQVKILEGVNKYLAGSSSLEETLIEIQQAVDQAWD